jgi:tRNA-Thr(GGU) m(6)t(6)A37 methyltransferase TsaA
MMHQYMAGTKQTGTNLELHPVGIIRSPYRKRGDAPRQGRLADTESTIEILPAYAEALQDVEKNAHLIALYWFDRSDRTLLKATPPGSGVEHGVFATRSPERPNPIGFAVVDLLRRDGNRLTVRGLDAFDGTPLLDLKPYYSDLDCISE